MKKPFFSIILTTFRRSDFLKIAIKSVLNQDFKNYEFLILDDASGDDTETVVLSFQDKRIRYIKNKKNIGLALNLKQGFKKSKGEYVFLLSDDDVILQKDTLSVVYKIAKKNKFGIALLGLIFYDKNILVPSFRAAPFYKKTVFIPASKDIFVKTVSWHTDFISGNIYKRDMVRPADIIDDVWLAHTVPAMKIMQNKGIVYFGTRHIVGRISRTGNVEYLNIDKNKGYHMEKMFDSYRNFDSNDERLARFKNPHLENVVKTLPGIKYYTSNKNVIMIAREVLRMMPKYKKQIIFWVNLFLAVLTPKFVLGMTRKIKLIFDHLKIKDYLNEINYKKHIAKIENI